MKWHTNGTNTWSTSSLNTYLNGEYLTSLGTLADKIVSTTWKVGGNTWDNIYSGTPATTYTNEITNPTENTTYSAKIGLMYVSDYGFAADQIAWTTVLHNYNSNSSKDWLYLGSNEWTISRNSDSSSAGAFCVYSGYVGYVRVTNSYAVRPSFNLNSSATYVSGDGTQSNPIRIN